MWTDRINERDIWLFEVITQILESAGKKLTAMFRGVFGIVCDTPKFYLCIPRFLTEHVNRVLWNPGWETVV